MLSGNADFVHRLEFKIRQQLSSRRIGYLLGAGASYLNGNGYPLSAQIWEKISDDIPEKERRDLGQRARRER